MQRPPAHLCAAENMRREGFELSVSPPRVVLREEEGGSRVWCCLAMQGAGAASVPPLLRTAVAVAGLPLQLPPPLTPRPNR